MQRRRVLWVLAAVLALGGLALEARARVTEKVEAMIAENTPLKVKDNDLWFMAGGPLVFGVQYDKFATANVALGMGVGSFLNGTSFDLNVKYFFLNGKFSPFLSGGGVFYYSEPRKNIFALDVAAGVSYYFDTGFGLSLALAYVKGISQSLDPFSYTYVNDSINWLSPQFGIHCNF